MKKNKIYKITTTGIIFDLLFSVVIVVAFIVFSIWFINGIDHTGDDFWVVVMIFFSFIGFMASYLVFLPIYLCWSYYQREKNVTIFMDYEKAELQYIEIGKATQYIAFEDIDIIEKHTGFRIGFWYYNIILKNGSSIIITSLLIGDNAIDRATPDMRSKIEYTGNLFLPKNNS